MLLTGVIIQVLAPAPALDPVLVLALDPVPVLVLALDPVPVLALDPVPVLALDPALLIGWLIEYISCRSIVKISNGT